MVMLLGSVSPLSKGHLEAKLQKILADLRKDQGIRVKFFIGGEFASLAKARLFYKRALSMLDHAQAEKGEILWYDSGMELESGYYFPIEEEARLIALMKMGEVAEAIELIDELSMKNHSIPFENREMLGAELCAVFSKIRLPPGRDPEGRSAEEILAAMRVGVSLNGIVDYMKQLIRFVCGQINETRKSKTEQLKEEILGFIEETWREPMLNLTMVASRFRLSEKYVSRFFKENTGQTIIHYIENRRLSSAIELMKDKNLSLKEISCSSGYQNIDTFSKAFRRAYGTSPCAYRTKLYG
jgi:AraC-like DNA-binding protein